MNPENDAQRELEQHALRNVRGLVEKIEAKDDVDRRSQKRIVVAIAVFAVVLAVLIGWFVKQSRDHGTSGQEIVVPPKPAPAAPPSR
jgi:hypothetical protein